MTPTLKECPFCGSRDIRMMGHEDDPPLCGECASCGSTGKYMDTYEEAFKHWNTRASIKTEGITKISKWLNERIEDLKDSLHGAADKADEYGICAHSANLVLAEEVAEQIEIALLSQMCNAEVVMNELKEIKNLLGDIKDDHK